MKSNWMDGWMCFVLHWVCSCMRDQKYNNKGITLQMGICTRPLLSLCMRDWPCKDQNSRYSEGRMLQIKAPRRKLNCQMDGEGGSGGLSCGWFFYAVGLLVQMSHLMALTRYMLWRKTFLGVHLREPLSRWCIVGSRARVPLRYLH